MFVIVNVRQRGAIGVSYPKGFELPGPNSKVDLSGMFEIWQQHYGDKWEPLTGLKLPGKCARTACDVQNAVCNHTLERHRLYCPKCARAINEYNGNIVEWPEALP